MLDSVLWFQVLVYTLWSGQFFLAFADIYFDVNNLFKDFCVNTHNRFIVICMFIFISYLVAHVYLWTKLRSESCTNFTELRKIVNFRSVFGVALLGNKGKGRNVKMFTVFKFCLKKAKVILYLSTTADTRLNENKLLISYIFKLHWTTSAKNCWASVKQAFPYLFDIPT